jgi:hypothetical protein
MGALLLAPVIPAKPARSLDQTGGAGMTRMIHREALTLLGTTE